MKKKIVLEIEELEERIAPHAWLGGGHSPVLTHGGNMQLPNGELVQLPEHAYDTISANGDSPIDPPGNATGRA
jgi:hypothetical protein